MNKFLITVVVIGVGMAALAGCEQPAEQAQQSPPPAEAKPKVGGVLSGNLLLVNSKTMPSPFFLKDYEVVELKGQSFLRGVVADVGNDRKDVGLTVMLAVDDVAVIREFTWDQARAYYGALFRERRPNGQ